MNHFVTKEGLREALSRPSGQVLIAADLALHQAEREKLGPGNDDGHLRE